jgi:glycine C-acetyltransferase/8-amino-7-oxononanoate synthase
MPEGAARLSPPAFFAAAAAGLGDALRACAAAPGADAVAAPRADLGPDLAELRDHGLHRRLRTIRGGGNGEPAHVDGREALILCSNDYLGLRTHPAVREAAAAAAERWGAGAGSSRLVAGNLELHHRLERAIADFKGYEACVLFGSGYLANTGVIPALAGPGDVILSDALNHASIIDGCRQSRARTIVYEHGSLEALAEGLARADARPVRRPFHELWLPRRNSCDPSAKVRSVNPKADARPPLIVTDALFSMDGDLAPIEGIVELAGRHGARVLVDEAHATGVIGPGGRGLVAELGLERDVDVVVGTLSKALGSYGAFACCSRPQAEVLVNRARTLIFSTALPPPSTAAALAALDTLTEHPELVDRLHANARLVRRKLAAAGFSVAENEIPIVPLIVGHAEAALALCEAALSDGLFVQAIRPPTVPKGTSRLRLTVAATHTEGQLRTAAAALARAWEVLL